MGEEVEKLSDRLRLAADAPFCPANARSAMLDADAALQRLQGERDEAKLSEAELEQACKDLDLEIEGLRAQVEAMRRALERARSDMFQMHDWIAEETRDTKRITYAARYIGDIDAALSATADQVPDAGKMIPTTKAEESSANRVENLARALLFTGELKGQAAQFYDQTWAERPDADREWEHDEMWFREDGKTRLRERAAEILAWLDKHAAPAEARAVYPEWRPDRAAVARLIADHARAYVLTRWPRAESLADAILALPTPPKAEADHG